MANTGDNRRGRWRAVDILSIAFLLFLTSLTLLLRYRIPRWGLLVTLYLSLTGFLLFLIYADRKHGRFFEVIHDFVFPVATVFLIFDSLGGLVHHINPADRDEILIKIDYFLFGLHPTVWIEGLSNPFLTEILQIAYSTYYFLPIIFGIFLKMHHKKEEFEISLFLVIFCFYLSFLGYILVPAIGPRFTLDHLQITPYKNMEGILLAEFIRNTLDTIEGIKRDAFPSGHSAVALVVLYLSYRFEKGLFLIYLPLISALLFSTIYLRYHYVIDVIAGIFLAIGTIYFGEKLYKKWERKGYHSISL